MEQAELIFNPNHLYPEIFLFVAAIAMTIIAAIAPKANSTLMGYISMAVFLIAGALVVFTDIGSAYGDLFINDHISVCGFLFSSNLDI